ncbi:MAG: hypothetical protein IKU84_03335 [Clostridia bacterium]|nr:hypothetical protein [Clostridia bacterium]
MLEIDSSVRRIKTDTMRVLEQKVLRVKIPNFKPRTLKKASKVLYGKRVIVDDECDEEPLLKYGITPIIPLRLYSYLAGEIYLKTLKKFEISPEKTSVAIFCGGLANFTRYGLEKIIKNAGYLSISSRDSSAFSEYVMEEYGISVTQSTKNADISVFIYEKEFSLQYRQKNVCYILSDTKIVTDKNVGDIPKTHLKSVCLALVESGSISPEDLVVNELIFKEEKLT